jgi:hypothetical protein
MILQAAFADALSAGSMRIGEADTPVSLVGGVAQVSNLYLEGDNTALRGGMTLDLATNDLDADFSYAAIDGPGDVEAMPSVGLSFAGPLAAPERELDVSQVGSFLNVRQLELEIQRVEALNAEILERERLLRIMAAVDLDRERLDFERDEAAREQERLAREAEERVPALLKSSGQPTNSALRKRLPGKPSRSVNGRCATRCWRGKRRRRICHRRLRRWISACRRWSRSPCRAIRFRLAKTRPRRPAHRSI